MVISRRALMLQQLFRISIINGSHTREHGRRNFYMSCLRMILSRYSMAAKF